MTLAKSSHPGRNRIIGTYERDHKQQCLRHKNQSPGLALDRPPDQDPILIPVPAPAPDLDQESADMALGLALDQDPIPHPTTVNGTTHGSTRTNGSFGATTEASGGHIISGAEVKAFSAAAFSVVEGVDITTTITKTGKTSGSTLSSNRSSTTPTAPRGAVHALPRSSQAARRPAAIPAALTGHPQGDRHSRTTLPPPTLGLPNALAKI